MKKSLSLILSFVMLLSVLTAIPFSASALPSYGTLGTDGTEYSFKSGTVEVVGVGTTMHNYTNMGEDVSPFKDSAEIKKAMIMNTMNVGSFLFIGCSNLTTVEITHDNTTIGDNAFFNCTSLETVKFYKDALTTVQPEAFGGCTGLKEFKFPKTLTSLGNLAFAGCSSLERVIIPNPNCYIADGAFKNCAKLKGFTHPEITTPMKMINSNVFKGCSAMKKVSLPGNIDYVGAAAFDGCTALTDVYFEGTQEKWDAIYWQPNNDAAKNATLHCNCEWGYCGDNVEYVYNNVDKTLTISGTGMTDKYYNDLGASAPWYSYKDDITSVVIEEGVTGIGMYAFANETNLKSVSLPKSVTGVDTNAFWNSNAITEVKYAGTEEEFDKNIGGIGVDKELIAYTPAPGGSEQQQQQQQSNTAQNTTTPDTTTQPADTQQVASATTAKKITAATLSKTAYTYDGKAKKPTVTVKYGKTVLKKDKDYTVTYAKGRKNVGAYKVTIKGKGNYTGTKVLTFKINPKGTSVSKVTSPKKKQLKVYWKKQATQTTGYEIQYATKSNFSDAKTVTVNKPKTATAIIKKNVKSKKKYYVRIRTYKTVSGKKFCSSWSKAKSIKTK